MRGVELREPRTPGDAGGEGDAVRKPEAQQEQKVCGNGEISDYCRGCYQEAQGTKAATIAVVGPAPEEATKDVADELRRDEVANLLAG